MVSYMKWRQPLGRRRSAYYWQTRAKLFRAPEGQRKLAGGGAKRNHRDRSKKIVRVPAGTPDRNSQQNQSRSGALSGRVMLSWRFRRLRLAPPPANILRASGALGVCQQYPELLRPKGSADLCAGLTLFLQPGVRNHGLDLDRHARQKFFGPLDHLPNGDLFDLFGY